MVGWTSAVAGRECWRIHLIYDHLGYFPFLLLTESESEADVIVNESFLSVLFCFVTALLLIYL